MGVRKGLRHSRNCVAKFLRTLLAPDYQRRNGDRRTSLVQHRPVGENRQIIRRCVNNQLVPFPRVWHQKRHREHKRTRCTVNVSHKELDRAGTVEFFMTDVYGAPRAFVFAMPFLMPNAWKRNKLVVHTTPYDLTILADRSVLNERRSSISVPALIIGGEKSPKELRDAVSAVAKALPNAHNRFLPGQDHNISSSALVPVLVEFFG